MIPPRPTPDEGFHIGGSPQYDHLHLFAAVFFGAGIGALIAYLLDKSTHMILMGFACWIVICLAAKRMLDLN